MNQWIRVEFYAQLPDGQQLGGIDRGETARTLAEAFGFRFVEMGSVGVVPDRGPRRSMLPDPPPAYIEGEHAAIRS